MAYLSFETIALLAYWVMLWQWPAHRPRFVPPGGDDRALFAFAAGDLLLYAVTGALGAIGLWRTPNECGSGPRWLPACLWMHAGAAMYAALYAVTLWTIAPDRLLGALMMLPALAAPLWIAVRFGRSRE